MVQLVEQLLLNSFIFFYLHGVGCQGTAAATVEAIYANQLRLLLVLLVLLQ